MANAVVAENAKRAIQEEDFIEERPVRPEDPAYLQVMDCIEQTQAAS